MTIAIGLALPARYPYRLEGHLDYDILFSNNLPAPVEMHPALTADAKYIFSVTNAAAECIHWDRLSAAMTEALRREWRDLGPYPPPQGHPGLREAIREGLKQNRGVDTDLDSIFLSSGAGGAIQCIVQAFIDPADVVLVEEFTYSGTLRTLMERRAEVVHVPTDEHGMDTDALETAIKDLAARGRRPKMIYTISVYQNPMGMTLGLDRRRRMVEISHRYGVPIFENESYADFRIDGDPLPPAMMAMDDEDSVMYVSAYTKLLGCGLRLGFAVVPPPVRETLARIRFGGSPSHLAAMLAHEYLADHRQDHVEETRQALMAKRDAMLAALGESFGPECSWSRPGGGMMIWVRLPEGADTWAALDKAVQAGVKYNPGPTYRAPRDRSNYLRLAYSHNSPEEIREGVGILADVFEREGILG